MFTCRFIKILKNLLKKNIKKIILIYFQFLFYTEVEKTKKENGAIFVVKVVGLINKKKYLRIYLKKKKIIIIIYIENMYIKILQKMSPFEK